MNNYILGIMWSIGTLQKGTNRYFIQTFDEDKVYYLEKIAALKGKTVATKERMSRGKTRTMYTIFISDADYALRLRDMGYDDPEVEIPEHTSDDFIAAILELNIIPYMNNGYENFRIISNNCKAWETVFKRYGIDKDLSEVDTINIGKQDMSEIATYMLDNVEKSNKSFWEDILVRCGKIE